jgi:signal transduction histidine kinase
VQLALPPIVNSAGWAGRVRERTVGVMATSVPSRGGPARRYRRVPWSPRAWSQTLYLTGAIPAQLLALIVLVPWWAIVLEHRPGAKAMAWQVVLLMLLMLLVFLAVPLFTAIHRHRLRATAGVQIPPLPVIPGRLSGQGIVAAARARATWRQLGYHLLAGPALAAAAITVIGMWLAGVLYTLVYAYAWTLPARSLLRRGQSAPLPGHLPPFSHIPMDVYLTGCGIALLTAAPWLTAAVGALLGPSRAEELEYRVQRLAQTRAGVVDAADAERRRLERDLHDGTQQRLVSLAMRLGMARAERPDAAQAQQVIAEAHEEAKAALLELRHLVRGLHPAVLEDRGLDAALSGVAARLPIPVRLTVDVPRRPPPTIEAVAYFVVSEGLTNITKHAQASQAEVFVRRANDRLHIIVSDDGVGGADPAGGTGLAGLANRAASVDGTLEIVSPPGGPTLLTVDLPCAR